MCVSKFDTWACGHTYSRTEPCPSMNICFASNKVCRDEQLKQRLSHCHACLEREHDVPFPAEWMGTLVLNLAENKGFCDPVPPKNPRYALPSKKHGGDGRSPDRLNRTVGFSDLVAAKVIESSSPWPADDILESGTLGVKNLQNSANGEDGSESATSRPGSILSLRLTDRPSVYRSSDMESRRGRRSQKALQKALNAVCRQAVLKPVLAAYEELDEKLTALNEQLKPIRDALSQLPDKNYTPPQPDGVEFDGWLVTTHKGMLAEFKLWAGSLKIYRQKVVAGGIAQRSASKVQRESARTKRDEAFRPPPEGVSTDLPTGTAQQTLTATPTVELIGEPARSPSSPLPAGVSASSSRAAYGCLSRPALASCPTSSSFGTTSTAVTTSSQVSSIFSLPSISSTASLASSMKPKTSTKRSTSLAAAANLSSSASTSTLAQAHPRVRRRVLGHQETMRSQESIELMPMLTRFPSVDMYKVTVTDKIAEQYKQAMKSAAELPAAESDQSSRARTLVARARSLLRKSKWANSS